MVHKPIPNHPLFNEEEASALVQLRPELFTAVSEIAEQEQHSVGAIVNDLLAFAISYRQTVQTSVHIWEQLTRREQEVAVLIHLGMTNPEISKRLSIARNTVKTHIKNILVKYNANSKVELRHLLADLDLSEWIALFR